MFKTNIVDLVKDLRKETNVSQEELANYIWVSRLTYISVENWKRKFKEKEVEKVSELFEKTLSYFYEEIEKKEDKNYKLKQLILYISKKTEDIPSFWKTVLNKLLYFSDFNHYEWTTELITGTIYKKLPYWPVPENITEVLEEMKNDWEIAVKENSFHNYNQQKIIAVKEPDLLFLDELDIESKKECWHMIWLPKSIEIIDNVLNKFAHWTATQISEWSHMDKPYKSAKKIGDIVRPRLSFYRSEAFITNPNNL
jgi:DNA-binding XRE family transcriptional regulator